MIIPSAEGITLGGKAFPSYVAITADGQMIVGAPARRQATANPEGTAAAFKCLMGHREKVRLRNKEFSPKELSGFLLQTIKRAMAAHKLVLLHLRLVAKMAMCYRGYGLPVADVIGEGNVGLM